MQISAEIRWFWPSSDATHSLLRWFREAEMHGIQAGGGGVVREDRYLYAPDQVELGIKQRGKKAGIEMKGLVSVKRMDPGRFPFTETLEVWAKWSTEALRLDSFRTTNVKKLRWLRKFDTAGEHPLELELDESEALRGTEALPGRGCNVEFAEATLDNGAVWYTFGIEAFGPLESVERSAQMAAAVLAERHPPFPAGGGLLSYPAWLRDCAGE